MAEDMFGNEIEEQDPVEKLEDDKKQTEVEELKWEADRKAIKPFTGAGAPTVTPRYIGDMYFDSTNNIVYISTGVTSSNWLKLSSTDTGLKMGWVDSGNSVNNTGANQIHATRVTAPYTTLINRLAVSLGAVNANIKFVIGLYSTNATPYPDTLLGQTSEYTTNADDDYKRLYLDLSSPYSVVKDTEYWIAVSKDNTLPIQVSEGSSSNYAIYASSAYSSTLPSTFPAKTGNIPHLSVSAW